SLSSELGGQAIEQRCQQLVVCFCFLQQARWVDIRQPVEISPSELETAQIQVFVARHETAGRFDCSCAALCSLHHPEQHASVVAEAWPEEAPVSSATKPVHAKDGRRMP